MIPVIITALAVGAAAGYLGTLLITERLALVGGPLGHVALPGVALALLFGFDIFWGGLGAIVIGAALIWVINAWSKLPLETVTAIVFASTVAAGFLILPLDSAEAALVGDITEVTATDAVLAVVIAVIAFVVIRLLYRGVVLAGLSEDLARSMGVKVGWHRFLYLAVVAIVVALEVKLVGVLLTAALIAIPAAAAKRLAHSLTMYRCCGAVAGGLSTVGGVVLYELTGFPAGPLIILCSAGLFFLTLLKRAPWK